MAACLCSYEGDSTIPDAPLVSKACRPFSPALVDHIPSCSEPLNHILRAEHPTVYSTFDNRRILVRHLTMASIPNHLMSSSYG